MKIRLLTKFSEIEQKNRISFIKNLSNDDIITLNNEIVYLWNIIKPYVRDLL